MVYARQGWSAKGHEPGQDQNHIGEYLLRRGDNTTASFAGEVQSHNDNPNCSAVCSDWSVHGPPWHFQLPERLAVENADADETIRLKLAQRSEPTVRIPSPQPFSAAVADGLQLKIIALCVSLRRISRRSSFLATSLGEERQQLRLMPPTIP